MPRRAFHVLYQDKKKVAVFDTIEDKHIPKRNNTDIEKFEKAKAELLDVQGHQHDQCIRTWFSETTRKDLNVTSASLSTKGWSKPRDDY